MLVDVVQIELKCKYRVEIESDKGYVYGIEDCCKVFGDLIGKSNIEMLGVICLDGKNEIINYSTVAIGDVSDMRFSVAQIAKVALLSNSSMVVIAHNHPTGILEVTENDINATRKIARVLNDLDIKLIDSLIVNRLGECISIREKLGEKISERENI